MKFVFSEFSFFTFFMWIYMESFSRWMTATLIDFYIIVVPIAVTFNNPVYLTYFTVIYIYGFRFFYA